VHDFPAGFLLLASRNQAAEKLSRRFQFSGL
jgi:hypothetical protein